jgi:hypothetical protein
MGGESTPASVPSPGCPRWRPLARPLFVPPAPETTGPPHDLARLVEALDRHHVDYLLCGGAAAVAYGATRHTEDADCVVRREYENLERLWLELCAT